MRNVLTGTWIALALGLAHGAQAEIFHRETINEFRAVSIAYDAQVCGIWVANESNEVVLLSTFGKELRRFETGMRSVRSLTVEEDGILIASGWGEFRRLDREGRAIDTPFRLSETLYDTEGLHRDADGSFLVVEDDPSRLLRIAPDGTVLMELFGDSFDPPMTEPQGVTRDSIFRQHSGRGRQRGFEQPLRIGTGWPRALGHAAVAIWFRCRRRGVAAGNRNALCRVRQRSGPCDLRLDPERDHHRHTSRTWTRLRLFLTHPRLTRAPSSSAGSFRTGCSRPEVRRSRLHLRCSATGNRATCSPRPPQDRARASATPAAFQDSPCRAPARA